MTGLVLIVVLLGLMWAVVVLPQQRRVKAHQRLCDRIAVGHVVMTTAGLFGTVVEAGTDRLVLEVAPGVRTVVDRRSVGMLVPDGTSLADLADVSQPTPEPVPPTATTMGERLGLGAPAAATDDAADDDRVTDGRAADDRASGDRASGDRATGGTADTEAEPAVGDDDPDTPSTPTALGRRVEADS